MNSWNRHGDVAGVPRIGRASGCSSSRVLWRRRLDEPTGTEAPRFFSARPRDGDHTFGTEGVPLIEQATRPEFAGGVTPKLGPASASRPGRLYQHATDEGAPTYRRDSVKGDIGVRFAR
jgi:hypothetical protein